MLSPLLALARASDSSYRHVVNSSFAPILAHARSSGSSETRSVSVLVVLLALGIAGCARRMPPRASAADAERASVALAELEQGRSLVISKCGSRCHKPPMPRDMSIAEWPKQLAEMGPRANLDVHERHLIEQYLITMAGSEPSSR